MPFYRRYSYGPVTDKPNCATHHSFNPLYDDGFWVYRRGHKQPREYHRAQANRDRSQDPRRGFVEQYGDRVQSERRLATAGINDDDLARYRESPARTDRPESYNRRDPTGRHSVKDAVRALDRAIAGRLDPRHLDEYEACRQYAEAKRIRITLKMPLSQLENMQDWIREEQQHFARRQYREGRHGYHR